ncbi:MAG: DUF1049 domain-containing protein [Xanthomonadales bacterium]|nr:DUF1049 domain-containing protein [Xanthomonadales bacterium]
MRLIPAACVLGVLLAGALFGAFNTAPVLVDFHFAQVALPLGPALLLALALGWVLGGLTAWYAGAARRRAVVRATVGGTSALPVEPASRA